VIADCAVPHQDLPQKFVSLPRSDRPRCFPPPGVARQCRMMPNIGQRCRSCRRCRPRRRLKTERSVSGGRLSGGSVLEDAIGLTNTFPSPR
jgi:hypothetical protein